MTTYITYREQQVIALVAQNLPNKSIADVLNVHVKTIEKLRQGIHRKLNAHCGIDVTHFAIQHGLVKIRTFPIGGAVIFLDKGHGKNTVTAAAKSERPFLCTN
jgi:DNA-binding CsgD family transcriptional regulator